MKITSANSVFSIILNYITHKYVVSSKASEVDDFAYYRLVITRVFYKTQKESIIRCVVDD